MPRPTGRPSEPGSHATEHLGERLRSSLSQLDQIYENSHDLDDPFLILAKWRDSLAAFTKEVEVRRLELVGDLEQSVRLEATILASHPDAKHTEEEILGKNRLKARTDPSRTIEQLSRATARRIRTSAPSLHPVRMRHAGMDPDTGDMLMLGRDPYTGELHHDRESPLQWSRDHWRGFQDDLDWTHDLTLLVARELRALLDMFLDLQAFNARHQGHSWKVIGQLLGVSHQAAQQRVGPSA